VLSARSSSGCPEVDRDVSVTLPVEVPRSPHVVGAWIVTVTSCEAVPSEEDRGKGVGDRLAGAELLMAAWLSSAL